MACGFEAASLRKICARAKVTTGAFYAHFKKKEDLFAAIVEPELKEYLEVYDGLLGRLTAKAQRPDDSELSIMEYLLEHRELFKLLFDCSAGTKYAGFKDQLIEKFEATYQDFFDAYAPEPVDHNVTKTIVQMKFAQYCAMLFGKYKKKEALEITDRLQTFTQAGFGALLQTNFESPA